MGLSIISRPGGDDAGGNHRGHRVTGFAHVVEAGHDAARQLRLGHQLDRHFGGHGQHALAAHHHAAAGRSRAHPAPRCRRSIGSPSTVKPRTCSTLCSVRPYFEAVHAARVLGHVAADGAGDLAGLGRARSTGHSGAAASLMARLRTPHCTTAVRASGSTFEDLVELGQRQRHAQRVRHAHRPTARCPRHAPPPARCRAWQALQHRAATCASVSGKATSQRALAVGGEAIALVGRGVFGLARAGRGRAGALTARAPRGLARWRARVWAVASGWQWRSSGCSIWTWSPLYGMPFVGCVN